MVDSLHAYLTITVGSRAGEVFPLDPERENHVGRGGECSIMVTDPLCSRIHATLVRSAGQWRIFDANSRNGTFVNGQKVDEAALSNGHYLRVGSTEFAFHLSNTPPAEKSYDGNITQTIVRSVRGGMTESGTFAVAAIGDPAQAQDLLLLYQLSIKLLGCSDTHAVPRTSLELLRERVQASVAGFLWIDDAGQLKPELLIPDDSHPRLLSEPLTRQVREEGRAVWMAVEQPSGEGLDDYSDAVCVPLVSQGRLLGAIHAYLERGRFRQQDFDFAISLANITAVALARARHEDRLETDFQRLKSLWPGYDEFVGECPAVVDLKAKISRLGRATGCVLIHGESGTGKELVARALHRASPRADRPMISVNCAAIPADLMESQLFGHKAGSFTGADRDHIGYFQQADQRTLFLDEVGEMTLQGQSKLLRILEGHPFLPVGGTQEIRVDVRVIAATNRNLLTNVREKKFREDLYYRLCVFELHIPPLRERGSDVGLLVDFFMDHFRQQHGRPSLTLARDAREKLLRYSWPGNVRQLRNVIDSAVLMAGGERIEVDDLALHDASSEELDSLLLDHWERKLILESLRRTANNVPEAAKLLGIGRATLYRKLDQYHIRR